MLGAQRRSLSGIERSRPGYDLVQTPTPRIPGISGLAGPPLDVVLADHQRANDAETGPRARAWALQGPNLRG